MTKTTYLSNTPSNLILIGMPGSGKSTTGVLLAKELGMDFIDTDVLIQVEQQQSLQDILDHQGYLALRDIEEQTLLTVKTANTVIATGGSAVYSHAAMAHLNTLGTIVFLDVSLPCLMQRVNNESSRGIARPPQQSFADVYAERTPLYNRYANVTYNNENNTDIDTLVLTIKQHTLTS